MSSPVCVSSPCATRSRPAARDAFTRTTSEPRTFFPTAATASASGGLSVEKTPIAELIKNEKAKAAIEAALPPITQYYDQIGAMTLAQVAPMSQGALDDAKLKALQAKFDEINAGK